MTMTEHRAPATLKEKYDDFEYKLHARASEFADVLPSHIKPAHFQRVALTAVQQNPKLLEADQRSLFNAIKQCAQDGLIPDGRQAVLVVYASKHGPMVRYQQMVAGVRILVQRSGEISRFEQTIVHENDEFEYRLGDRPEILHKPALTDRGKPILAYSIAQYRDGTLSREVMDTAEIEKARRVSRYSDDGPWKEWWSEMARKTIAKRHAKVLPMAADAAEALARDDDYYKPLASYPTPAIESRPRLAERLDNLGPTQPTETPSRRRRRPHSEDPEGAGRMHDGGEDDAPPPVDVPPESIPDALQKIVDEVAPTADFLAGVKDAEAGRVGCLNREIKDDPLRLRDWQAGFNSVKPRHDTPSV